MSLNLKLQSKYHWIVRSCFVANMCFAEISGLEGRYRCQVANVSNFQLYKKRKAKHEAPEPNRVCEPCVLKVQESICRWQTSYTQQDNFEGRHFLTGALSTSGSLLYPRLVVNIIKMVEVFLKVFVQCQLSHFQIVFCHDDTVLVCQNFFPHPSNLVWNAQNFVFRQKLLLLKNKTKLHEGKFLHANFIVFLPKFFFLTETVLIVQWIY